MPARFVAACAGLLGENRYGQDFPVGARPPSGTAESLNDRHDPVQATEARIGVKRAPLRDWALPPRERRKP